MKKDKSIILHVSAITVTNRIDGVARLGCEYNCHGFFNRCDYDEQRVDKFEAIEAMKQKVQEKCGQQVEIIIRDHTIAP